MWRWAVSEPKKQDSPNMWRGFSERDRSTLQEITLWRTENSSDGSRVRINGLNLRCLFTSANSIFQKVVHGFGFVVSLSLLWQWSTHWRSTKGPMTPDRLTSVSQTAASHLSVFFTSPFTSWSSSVAKYTCHWGMVFRWKKNTIALVTLAWNIFSLMPFFFFF